jgi:alkaline phosphatase D
MESSQEITQAKKAIQHMDFALARRILTDLVVSDSQNIEAWLLLARVSLERDDAIQCLQQVLNIDPNHQSALDMLNKFQFNPKTKRPADQLKKTSQKSSGRTMTPPTVDLTTKEPYLVLGPIIGGLSPSGVKLWGRASGPSILHAWISNKTSLKPYLAGKTTLAIDAGYSGVIEINGLEPQTEYRYALNFSTAPPPDSEYKSFKTAPPKYLKTSFQFAFGSCFRPTNKPESGGIFKRILDSHPELSFLVMLGDQIYADDWNTNGLDHIALNAEDYRAVYRHTWTNPYLRELLRQIPVFMTLDDHEVDNDWHWCDTNKTLAKIPLYTRLFRWFRGRPIEESELSYHRVQEALNIYWEHQGIHAPTILGHEKSADESVLTGVTTTGPFAYNFEFGAAAFYVMDTRSQRVRSKEYTAVLGEDQWTDLEHWLMESNEQFPVKFIVTSSSFLTILLGDFANDRWSSFPSERDRLLQFISRNNISGVHFLTGDLHSGHAVSANLEQESGDGVKIWEFCSSPFEQNTNFLARLITIRNPSHYLWEDYRVHFIVDNYNYGIVTVFLNDPSHPSVHFDLHYLTNNGIWKTKSVSDIQ